MDSDIAKHMGEAQVRRYEALRWVAPAILGRLIDSKDTFDQMIGTTYFLSEAHSIAQYAVACFPAAGVMYPYTAVKHAERMADHYMTGALLGVYSPHTEHCPPGQ